MSRKIFQSRAILAALYQASQAAIDFYKFLYYLRGPYRQAVAKGGLAYVAELQQDEAARQLRRAVAHLKYRRYLKAKKVGDRLTLTLTDAGKRLALQVKLKQAAKLPQGEAILVMFDIPESQALARKTLRYFLKQNNFILLQRSVWFSRYDVFGVLAKLVADLKVKSFVCLARVNQLTKF